jgi:hypothetical protein
VGLIRDTSGLRDITCGMAGAVQQIPTFRCRRARAFQLATARCSYERPPPLCVCVCICVSVVSRRSGNYAVKLCVHIVLHSSR